VSYKNIILNSLKMPVADTATINDIIAKFFDLRCEFLVTRNAKPIPSNQYQLCRVKENDNFQIVTYSKHCYRPHKRTIFRPELSEVNRIEKGEE